MKDWSNLTADRWVKCAQELGSLAGPGLWQKKQNKNIQKAHLAFRTDFGLRKKMSENYDFVYAARFSRVCSVDMYDCMCCNCDP